MDYRSATVNLVISGQARIILLAWPDKIQGLSVSRLCSIQKFMIYN